MKFLTTIKVRDMINSRTKSFELPIFIKRLDRPINGSNWVIKSGNKITGLEYIYFAESYKSIKQDYKYYTQYAGFEIHYNSVNEYEEMIKVIEDCGLKEVR